MIKIMPSILAADFSKLGQEINDTVKTGADGFHLDIMDGHFVPNISFGPAVVDTVNKLTDLELSVHLMLSKPEDFFDKFIDAGADGIVFHIETHPKPEAQLQYLKERGVQAGLSLNPDKPFESLRDYLRQCDRLLIMSVYPGFSGQEFIESALKTIESARKYIDDNDLATRIAVDGGIDENNARRVVDAGADILVMGSAYYKSRDRRKLVDMVHALKRA
jgi:ribulose-phosphate 3-epimerase